MRVEANTPGVARMLTRVSGDELDMVVVLVRVIISLRVKPSGFG